MSVEIKICEYKRCVIVRFFLLKHTLKWGVWYRLEYLKGEMLTRSLDSL